MFFAGCKRVKKFWRANATPAVHKLICKKAFNGTLSLPHTWGKSWANYLARRLAQLFHHVCVWVFVRFSPREAVRKISVVFDIWDFVSRGEILSKTQRHTWGNSSADCLAMPRKAVCSALSSSVRQALALLMMFIFIMKGKTQIFWMEVFLMIILSR